MSQRGSGGPSGFDALNEIGKRLGDLAEHMKEAFENAESASEGGANFTGSSNQRTFTINTPRGPMTGTAGYSVRVGGLAGGQDAGEDAPLDAEYKPRRNKPQGSAAADEPREPLVDVYEEETSLLVTAELPGVALDDVTVALESQTLRIETSAARPFRTILELPCAVDPHSMKASLLNGILEVTFSRLDASETP